MSFLIIILLMIYSTFSIKWLFKSFIPPSIHMYVIKCPVSCLLKKYDPCSKCMLSLLLVVSNVVLFGQVLSTLSMSWTMSRSSSMSWQSVQQTECSLCMLKCLWAYWFKMLMTVHPNSLRMPTIFLCQRLHHLEHQSSGLLVVIMIQVLYSTQCVIWDIWYYSRVVVFWDLALMLDKYFLTFQRVTVPLSFGSSNIAFKKAMLLSLW